MRVEALLRQSALSAPDKVAVTAGDARLSYAELDTQSDRLAASLSKEGVGPGDRVAVLMENIPEAALPRSSTMRARARS
jgi:non-ribosomal peptide synthetase component E (peptide arylation enzyme)